MSATRLLVLGLVRRLGRAHGYRVSQELMAWEADKWANTKTGSIYHALRQLTKEGHLVAVADDDNVDNDSARTDYAITRAGDVAFFDMMAQALADAQPRSDALCAGLVFMSALKREDVLILLRRRQDALQVVRERTETVSREAVYEGEGAYPAHIQSLLSFQTHATLAQLRWLEEEIAKIETGAYSFAGESDAGQITARLAEAVG